MTNMLPDKTELTTLTQLMSAKGVRCGLVTTSTITHATPSGFAISCVNRDLEALIAEKYLSTGHVDVLMGGGDRFFAADKRKDKVDLYGAFAKAGYQVVKTRDDFMALKKGGKALGVFSSGHLPYTVDRDNDPKLAATVPTLSELASYALENLKSSKNGFLLQVEGARVDHGGHANDLAAMINDQIEFENAVKTCIDFAMKDGETLVVITADHACGGLAMNGAGDEYIDSNLGMKAISGLKSSYGPLLAAIGSSPTTSSVTDAAKAKLGLELTAAEADLIVSSLKGRHPFGGSTFFQSPSSTLGMVLGNHLKCTFTSGNHHSDHVLVTAYGPGSEHCSGLTWNTRFFELMTGFKDIKHKNPTMTFEAAIPHYEKLKHEMGGGAYAELSDLYGAHEECGCHGNF
jgi:alkaline phosphatase